MYWLHAVRPCDISTVVPLAMAASAWSPDPAARVPSCHTCDFLPRTRAPLHSPVAPGRRAAQGAREIAATWTLLEWDGGGYLLLRQRMRHGLPDSLLAWDPVPLDRGSGYRDARDSTEWLA